MVEEMTAKSDTARTQQATIELLISHASAITARTRTTVPDAHRRLDLTDPTRQPTSRRQATSERLDGAPKIGHCPPEDRSLHLANKINSDPETVTDSDRSVLERVSDCHCVNEGLTCTDTLPVTDSDRSPYTLTCNTRAHIRAGRRFTEDPPDRSLLSLRDTP